MALAEFIAEQFSIRAIKERECHLFGEKIQAVASWADKLSEYMPDNSPLAINVKVKVKVAGKRAYRIIKQLNELDDIDQTVEWLTSKSVKFTLARFSQTLDDTYTTLYNELQGQIVKRSSEFSLKDELQAILSTEFDKVREAFYSPDDIDSFACSDKDSFAIPFITLSSFAGAVRDLTSSVDSFANSISELKPATSISNGIPIQVNSEDVSELKSKITEMQEQIEDLQKRVSQSDNESQANELEQREVVAEEPAEELPREVAKAETTGVATQMKPIWFTQSKSIIAFMAVSQILLICCLYLLITGKRT